MAEEKTIRFSLSAAAAGSKRVAETPTPTKPNVPRVSELKMMEPRVTTPRPSTSAPVNICIYKVTENAADLVTQFEATTTELWHVQIDHDARPIVAVQSST